MSGNKGDVKEPNKISREGEEELVDFMTEGVDFINNDEKEAS